ncbi:MAG: RHS repeat protein, partial [bacterium]|nr:RHS repeat protein [bacterium]
GWEIVATYTYDAVGNVKTVEGPEVTNEVSGEPHRLLITNSYDDNSNLTKIVESDSSGTDPSRITLMGYDLNDREISVTDPEEGVLTREYDPVGNVLWVEDQLGRRTETEYDSRNLATKVWLRDFSDGHTPSVRDVRLSLVSYDAAGRKLTETDAEGRVTVWSYDDADRVTDVVRNDVVDHNAMARDVVLSHTTYDSAGNVKTQRTGDGTANVAIVTNKYDEAGRLVVSSLTGDGGTIRVTRFGYDPAGNVELVTRSEAGRTESTESFYDVQGRLVKTVVDPGGLALTTWFGYDARGNQIWVRDARSADEIDDTYKTTTDYDILSRATVVTSPTVDVETVAGTVSQDNPTQAFGYDTYSNVTHVRDERNHVTVSGY